MLSPCRHIVMRGLFRWDHRLMCATIPCCGAVVMCTTPCSFLPGNPYTSRACEIAIFLGMTTRELDTHTGVHRPRLQWGPYSGRWTKARLSPQQKRQK